jgi:2-keto-4-pentenoate hydratase/2-oxohepta-3-ene-1,7-dioic acid hydratase in catechol pathway
MLIARAWVGDRICFGEVTGNEFHGLGDDVFTERRRAGWTVPLADVQLLSPVEPRRMFAVIGGFMPADGSPLPEGTIPIIYPKITMAASGQDGQIVYPPWAEGPVVAEGEMGVVIGKQVHSASPSEAADAILGYTCFNDVTASEFFVATAGPKKDFLRAKSIESFSSFGPWIETDITQEQIESGLRIITRVNGEQKQLGNTKIFRFPPSVIISSLSTYLTFLPVDVIALGTPPPAAEINPGDLVEVEVDGIGILRNHVVSDDDAHGVAPQGKRTAITL